MAQETGSIFFARCNARACVLVIIKHGLTSWVHRHNMLSFYEFTLSVFSSILFSLSEVVLILRPLCTVSAERKQPTSPRTWPGKEAHPAAEQALMGGKNKI